jgi:hypothetical protein
MLCIIEKQGPQKLLDNFDRSYIKFDVFRDIGIRVKYNTVKAQGRSRPSRRRSHFAEIAYVIVSQNGCPSSKV